MHRQLRGESAQETRDSTNFSFKKRWRRVQELIRSFKKRWFREYKLTLSARKKWQIASRHFKVGDVVLVIDPESSH